MMVLQSFRKPLITGLIVAGLTVPCSAFSQNFEAHHKDYVAALHTVADGEENIVKAMQAVQSGQVAHYDFLQNELIELIRHSRALAWPPGNVSASTKATIQKEAHALRISAQALEWVISDFLRAIAQIRSATSNTLDIAEQASHESTVQLKADLEALIRETQMFMGSSYQRGWDELEAAFDTVLKGDISAQTNRELSFQKERLAIYPPMLSQYRQALIESDVDQRAAKLKAVYEAAI